MSALQIEITFNQALGDALRRTRQKWRDSVSVIQVEMINVLVENRAHRPDILVCDLDRRPVVIETSFDGADADLDARNRLGATTTDRGLRILTSISVFVDPKFREMASLHEITRSLLQGASVSYALHQLKSEGDTETLSRWPNAGFITGTVQDLGNLITAEALPKESVETIAQEVALKLRQAASRVEGRLSKENFDDLTSMVHQQTHLNALHTTMVLWLNAILVHMRLPPKKVKEYGGFELLDSMHPLPTKILEAWQRILSENWRSVFEPAVNVLTEFVGRDRKATSEALSLLIEAAELIETSRVGAHLNVGAELFPELADDRKESAAFYTQPATAEFLAHLTIRDGDLTSKEWKRSDLFGDRQIADLACGTGTLLRAAYRRVMNLHEHHGATLQSLANLHRGAMEHGLIGADISPIAAHLTASSLAIMNLEQTYTETQIGWLEVGGSSGMTGSLEYLKSNQVRDLFENLGGMSSGTFEASNGSTVVVSDRAIDWILMNPPYTRTRRGKSAFNMAGLSDESRKNCQRKWQTLVRNMPVDRGAGMASSFLALAAKKIRPGGRVGFVLPLTAAFAPTWKATRAMILREFHDVLVVAVQGGKALGKHALSADTGMEEMLLLATKNEDIQVNANLEKTSFGIQCVTLHKPLTRDGESGEIARSVLEASRKVKGLGKWYPVSVGDEEIGLVSRMPLAHRESLWSWVGVRHPGLAIASEDLLRGKLTWNNESIAIGLPMTEVDALLDVGPTHHLIGHLVGADDPIGAFEFHEIAGLDDALGADCSLWNADSQKQQRLVVQPTYKGVDVPFEDRSQLQETIRQSESKLFYARNMRWTSQALVSATTRLPVLGGRAWTSLQSPSEKVARAFVLWANSIFGLVTHWTQGQRTQVGRSTTQIDAIKSMPCPDLSKLDSLALERADREYSALCEDSLLPACQAHCDPTRANIDNAVAGILGMPQSANEIAREWRWLWCNEPSVHGNNSKALKLIQRSREGIVPRSQDS